MEAKEYTCVIEHCISEKSFIGLREEASGVIGVQYGKCCTSRAL